MANFRVINEKDAPRASKGSTRLTVRMTEYEQYVRQVGAGRVGEITPEGDDTPRGVALRVSRAAKRVGEDIETWVANGNVYFKSR